MGSGFSSIYEIRGFFEQKLSDKRRELARVLSKSNSMESLDKAEIKDIKDTIKLASDTLNTINKAIEDDNVPSF